MFVRRPRIQFDNITTESFPTSGLASDSASWRKFGRGMVNRLKTGGGKGVRRGGDRGARRLRSASFSGSVLQTEANVRNKPVAGTRRRIPSLKAFLDRNPVRPFPGRPFMDRSGAGRGDYSRHRPRSSSVSTIKMLSYYPGGSVTDPLNLRGVVSDEEQNYDSPDLPLPVPDPRRYDKPVNDFIPTNQNDPLGLMQDDDTLPPCQKMIRKNLRRRRVRSKKKDDGNIGAVSAADVEVSESESVTVVHSTTTENTSTSTSAVLDTDNSDTGNQPAGVAPTSTTKDKSVLKTSAMPMETEISETSSTAVSDNITTSEVMQESGQNFSDSVKLTASSAAVLDAKPGDKSGSDSAEASTESVAQPSKAMGPSGGEDGDSKTDMQSKGSRGKASKGSHVKQLLDKPETRRVGKPEHYPYIPSGSMHQNIGASEKVPQDRKSVLKALKIVPYKQEEKEEIIKALEKKDRDFKRMWRNPYLKSPEEKNYSRDRQTTSTTSSEALKIDTSTYSSSEKSQVSPLKGTVSKTVDSIVSPVLLQQDHPQIRKRRRTVSECSDYSRKSTSTTDTVRALHFRRSSSPDITISSPSTPKKMRRSSSGSGTSRYKKKTDSEINPSPVKFAKPKHQVFKHGNYYRYYGYRMPDLESDHRLQYFKLDWFEGKDVLDIGCNAGHVTLAIAQLFHPQKVVGMDIDPNLIRKARQNIRRCQTIDNKNEMRKFPASMTEYGPIEPLPALTNPSNYFPKNIMFMQSDYVLERDEQLNFVKEEYDTILALSITKWIHLNSGDAGLKRVFARIYRQLRPGGRLILEPQAWVSYRRRKKLTETIYNNYKSIKLKPENFQDYLLNKVGFYTSECIGAPYNPSKGFQRPLLLFRKYSDEIGTPVGTSHTEPRPIPIPISERMANLAGYSSTPELDKPYRGTPGPGLPFSFGPSPSSSNVGWGSPFDFRLPVLPPFPVPPPVRDYFAGTNSTFGYADFQDQEQSHHGVDHESNSHGGPIFEESNEPMLAEEETVNNPVGQAEEEALLAEPFEGDLLQPVHLGHAANGGAEEMELDFNEDELLGQPEDEAAVDVSYDLNDNEAEVTPMQNGSGEQNGNNGGWIHMPVENVIPYLAEDEISPSSPLQPPLNGSDMQSSPQQLAQNNVLDQNYSEQVLQENFSDESVEADTTEQSPRNSASVNLVEENVPGESVQADSTQQSPYSSSQQLVQEKSPQLSVQADSTEQSPRDPTLQQLVQDSSEQSAEADSTDQSPKDSSSQQLVQERSSELIVQADSTEQSPTDSSSQQFVQEESSEQSVEADSTHQSSKDSSSQHSVQEDSSEQSVQADSATVSDH